MKTRLLHTFTPRKFAIVIWKNNGCFTVSYGFPRKKEQPCPPHPSKNFPPKLWGKGLDRPTWAFILGCSMGHSFDTTLALCGLRFGCSCSVLIQIQVDEMWIPKCIQKHRHWFGFYSSQFHEIIHEIQNSWGFGYQTSIPTACHSTDGGAEAVLTKTMPRQVRLCWLNHGGKIENQVVDDIKGPCRCILPGLYCLLLSI